MKSILLTISICLALAAVAMIGVPYRWRGETLSARQVADRWGRGLFHESRFKDGNEAIRSSMAYSLMTSPKAYIGLDTMEIRKRLGDWDGFYFRDTFPAYMIQLAKSDKEDSWQLVFLLNDDFKVANIIVHKNCCDRK